MAWSRTSANGLSASSVSTGQSISLGTASTAGGVLVAGVQVGDNTTGLTSLTDSQGNTWTASAANPVAISATGRAWFFYLANAPSGITSVTSTLGGSIGNSLHVWELVPSPAQSAPLDHIASATGTGTAQNSGSTFTPTTASDFAIAGFVVTDASETFTAGTGQPTTPSGYTINATARSRSYSEYMIGTAASGAANVNATTSGSAGWVAWMLMLQAAGGGGGGAVYASLRMMMGIG